MKIIEILILIINIFSSFQDKLPSYLYQTEKYPKIRCTVDKIQSEDKINELTEKQKKNMPEKRYLQNDNFEPIRIYISPNKINTIISALSDELLEKVFDYLNNTISYIQN